MQVILYAYCGMPIPYGQGLDTQNARKLAARVIRKRRKQEFPVTTLESGKQWEIEEPRDCFLVPDEAGILVIKADKEEASDEQD